MTGVDIRNILVPRLSDLWSGTVTEELSIGWSRADVAIISDHLVGVEIKGDTDSVTSRRASQQMIDYSKVCRYSYFAVTERQLAKACETAPSYWGVLAVSECGVGVARKATESPALCKITLINKLWRLEIIDLLRARGKTKISGLQKPTLVKMAADMFSIPEAEKILAESVLHSEYHGRLRRSR